MLRCITIPHCPCSYENKALFVIDQWLFWATGACVWLSTVRYIVGFTDHPRSNMLSTVCTDLVLDHAFVSLNFLNVPCAHTCMHHLSFQLFTSVLWYIYYLYIYKNIDLKFAVHSSIYFFKKKILPGYPSEHFQVPVDFLCILLRYQQYLLCVLQVKTFFLFVFFFFINIFTIVSGKSYVPKCKYLLLN